MLFGGEILKKTNICKIISAEKMAEDVFDFTVESDSIASEAKAGQFLHIDCGDAANNLLRRPISICDVNGNNVRFVFQKKGSGTDALSCKKAGDTLDIMGPLGNGFIIMPESKKPVVIGGGIGIFPLYMLCRQLDNPTALLGFRSKERVCMENEFAKVAKTCVATDDGSYGYNGYAADVLEKMLADGECDMIYSCGPLPMLRMVKALAERYGVKCQISLEQRMGCGIGACLVCTCETIVGDAFKNKRVCKDGPVFWSSEVTLNG